MPATPGRAASSAVAEAARAPELSVIILIGERRARAGRALESVLHQDGAGSIEVLLMDAAAESHPALDASEDPRVRVVRVEPGSAFGRVRADGVRASSAPLVAFLEDHCWAHPGWLRALMAAHQGPWDAVGFEIHPANPGVGISDAVALMNYGPWLPPALAGENTLLPGHNCSYRREALLGQGQRLDSLLGAEAALQWSLALKGGRLYMEPACKVSHLNETRLSNILAGYFLWNRCFAPIRAGIYNWSLLRRLAWTLATPLVPLVRMLKLGRLAIARPEFWRPLIRWAPVIFLAQLSAALGQAVGLLAGEGDAPQRFLRYEVTTVRDA